MSTRDLRQNRKLRALEEALEQATAIKDTVGAVSSGVSGVREEVRELGRVVHVLMTLLAEKGLLDVEEIRRRLAQEATSPTKPVEAAPHPVTCVHCGNKVMSNTMVKVGADRWCQTCTTNL